MQHLGETNLRQETQLSLTNHVMHLCKCNGVTDGDPKKHPLPICVITPSLVVLGLTMYA